MTELRDVLADRIAAAKLKGIPKVVHPRIRELQALKPVLDELDLQMTVKGEEGYVTITFDNYETETSSVVSVEFWLEDDFVAPLGSWETAKLCIRAASKERFAGDWFRYAYMYDTFESTYDDLPLDEILGGLEYHLRNQLIMDGPDHPRYCGEKVVQDLYEELSDVSDDYEGSAVSLSKEKGAYSDIFVFSLVDAEGQDVKLKFGNKARLEVDGVQVAECIGDLHPAVALVRSQLRGEQQAKSGVKRAR